MRVVVRGCCCASMGLRWRVWHGFHISVIHKDAFQQATASIE